MVGRVADLKSKLSGLTRGDRMGVGCILLFALPFACVGAFMAYKTIETSFHGRIRDTLFFAIFAIVFGGVGIGLLYAALKAPRVIKGDQARKASHPDEPWLWREEWATGRIPSKAKTSMEGAWVFAIFWNAISSGVFFIVPNEFKSGNHLILVALLFPIVGLGLLVRAVRATIQWKKFGLSWFNLQPNPGVIGGQLAGVVETSAKLQPVAGYHLRLRCVRHDSRGESTSETILWEDEKKIIKDLGDSARSRIPVFFSIPGDTSPTDDSDKDLQMIWRLDVSAQVDGLDYFAQFEVPVFRTATLSAPVADPTLEFQASEKPYERPANSRIKVRAAPKGATEFYFPAARNWGTVVYTFIFLSIWTAVIYFMRVQKAPLDFQIVFGLMEVLILLVFLNLLLKSSRVTIDSHSLVSEQRWLFIARTKKLAAAEIIEVKIRTGLSSGQMAYQDLQVLASGDRKIMLATSIRDRKEAQWLAAEMNRLLLKLDNTPPPPRIAA